MVGDWKEIVEIIEDLVVLLVCKVWGTDKPSRCTFECDNSECQEGHRKTHGGMR